MSSRICEICKVPVYGEPWQHTEGKKHKAMLSLRDKREAQAEKSIYIRGFPERTTEEDLATHFQVHGQITSIHLQNNVDRYACIEFATRDMAQSALRRRGGHTLFHHHLLVKPRRPKPFRPPNNAEPISSCPTSSVSFEEVQTKLKSSQSVAKQILDLEETLALRREDLVKRVELKDKLQEVLHNRLPGCVLHQFGSSVTGLGEKGCDMDLYLDMNLEAPTPPNIPARMLQARTRLAEGSDMERLTYVTQTLTESRLPLSRVMKIPAKHCPIAQFVIKSESIKCDLSVKNSKDASASRLALKNTELLVLLLRADKRLKPFIHAIKYFFKAHNLTGGPSGAQKISSYAISWMVITYLQQLDPPILPSVRTLADLAEGDEKTETDGHDTSFTRRLDRISSTSNTAMLDELLVGFFHFYNEASLGESVICPREGRVLPITTFLKTDRPGQENFKIAAVNIQDPFDFSHNLMRNLNGTSIELLQEEIFEASAKCSSLQFSTPAVDRNWGLTMLFSEEEIAKPRTSIQSPAPDGYNMVIDVEFKASNFPRNLLSVSESVEAIKVQWAQKVCKLFVETLEEVFMFKCFTKSNFSKDDQVKQATKRRSCSEPSDEPVGKKVCGDSCSRSSKPTLTSEHEHNDSATGQSLEKLPSEPAVTSGHRHDDSATGQSSEKLTSEPAVTSGHRLDDSANGQSSDKVTSEPAVVSGHKHDDSATGQSSEKLDRELTVILMEGSCSTHQRLWMGRKNAKKALRKKGVEMDESLKTEIRVTKALQDGPPAQQPTAKLDLRITRTTGKLGKCLVRIQMRPLLEASSFFQSIQSFFPYFKEQYVFD